MKEGKYMSEDAEMATIGKSENLKNVDDNFFDAAEEHLGNECNKYSETSCEILATMKCKHCGGPLNYACEAWGGGIISWDGLHCKPCKKGHGWTGMDSYYLETKKRTGWFVRTFRFFDYTFFG